MREVQFRDSGAEVVDLREVQTDEQGVVFPEPAGQRLGQLWQLGTHSGFGHVGQDRRVTFTVDQRGEHGPAGDAHDVGGHRRQFDSGVFQEFLHALGLAAAFGGEYRAGPGQIAEFPDRLRRHERGPDQAVRPEVGEPLRVGDIGFAAGHVLGVAGVDEHHVQAVFEDEVERLPVHPRCFHHHQGHLLGDQMLAQGKDLIRGRTPGGDRAGR